MYFWDQRGLATRPWRGLLMATVGVQKGGGGRQMPLEAQPSFLSRSTDQTSHTAKFRHQRGGGRTDTCLDLKEPQIHLAKGVDVGQDTEVGPPCNLPHLSHPVAN